jgi:ABC-2 type transport system permease protein
MFSSTALTIAMVLLIGAAGVEQKKRSIIMPQTAGLTSAGYVLPKFMLYPPLVFAMTLLSALLSNVANRLVFGIAYSAETVLATGTLYGVSLMFSVCLYLLLGISLVQPGLSIIYVVAGNWLFSFMLNDVFGIDRFTPWSLISMADNIVIMGATPDMQAIAVTVAITIVLCAMLMLLTLYAMFAKRMDNTADEVY